MITYVALIRGVMPSNPKTRNAVLCKLFRDMGFENVRSLQASGNIIFEAPFRSTDMLENAIQKAFAKYLGLTNTVIVKSHNDLVKMIKNDPFQGYDDTPQSRLNVTFLKKKKYEE